MQYRKHSAKLWKVRFPYPYINFLKWLIVVFVHEQSVVCKFLQTIFWFITRVTLYVVISISMQLNVKIWGLWLCQASCILIYDLFTTHWMTENTIVLKLITSDSTFEVTNSLYKPQKNFVLLW